MAEYIEREAAYDTLTGYYHHRTDTQHGALREALNRVPAADVVPVKHGRWGKADCFTVGNKRYAAYQCSVCGAMYQEVEYGFSFCPNCGARMDGDGE